MENQSSNDNEVVQKAVSLLTPEGVAFFKRELKESFDEEVSKAFIYWQAAHSGFGFSRRPFQVTLNTWVQNFKERQSKQEVNKPEDWKKYLTEEELKSDG